jgi:2-dehydropantoate 2-reductase
MKTVTIIGNGALGLLFASLFAKQKVETKIITRTEESASRINKDGIFLTNLDNTTEHYKDNIYATANSKELECSDIVIILAKAYSTQDAIQKNIEHINKAENIITLQNGLGNVEIIQDYIHGPNIIAGTTSIGATRICSNKTKYCGNGMVDIASVNYDRKSNNILQEISNIFIHCGITCNIHKDWQTVIWSKLYVNAIINPITALYKVKNGEIPKQKELTELAKKTSVEILNILKEEHIDILLDEPFERALRICEITKNNQSSMLQDILNNKPTELNQITGKIIELAKHAGISSPVNQMLYDKLTIVSSLDS